MGSLWTIARQTISEGLRMRIALVFLMLMAVLLLGLPFISKGDGSISGAVQAFLTYSIMTVTFILGCLSIFLCKSISDDLAGKQILVLMTKPVSRWQYVPGKWLGVMTLTTTILVLSAAGIYGMTRYIASQPPRDDWDKERLESQVLTARHANTFVVPDFSRAAEQEYEKDQEEGKYADAIGVIREIEIAKNRNEIEQRWRTVAPLEQRRFDFENVRCDNSPENNVHIQYEVRVYNPPADEILRCAWLAGDREKGVKIEASPRRDVTNRKHTVTFSAQAVADDYSLSVWFQNVNPYVQQGEQQQPNVVVFEGPRAVEVLFSVSSFETNLIRALSLVWCRLAFLTALGVLTCCLFSFPVACLVSLLVYLMASTVGFTNDAIDLMPDEGVVESIFQAVAGNLVRAVYFVVPDFSKLNGLPMLVEGRNVTLKWVLMGLGQMVAIQTSVLLLAACLIFRRRQVSEVSV